MARPRSASLPSLIHHELGVRVLVTALARPGVTPTREPSLAQRSIHLQSVVCEPTGPRLVSLQAGACCSQDQAPPAGTRASQSRRSASNGASIGAEMGPSSMVERRLAVYGCQPASAGV